MEKSSLSFRVFGDCEERVGDGVSCYFKLNTVRVVLRALQPEQLALIRPAFGGLVELDSRLTFSRKLAQFLLSRQLVVGKNHDIWVVFCGKPIRFSLKKFVIVIDLRYSSRFCLL
ncbi:unnamed protein product [Arabis nemorensis]|uniref:DUF1985 domain-containing protein n=1 Tax=Arabis nemorensis TaxID=586526 RepID=A0A565BTC0_9BRAS|nr:unnamed protein product [Arabis nemorensis]